MSDVVNLRSARKRKARERAELQASGRRAKFGIALAARQTAQIRREYAERKLGAHRLDQPASGPSGNDE